MYLIFSSKDFVTGLDAHNNNFSKMTAYLASFVQYGRGGGQKISSFHAQGCGGGRPRGSFGCGGHRRGGRNCRGGQGGRGGSCDRGAKPDIAPDHTLTRMGTS